MDFTIETDDEREEVSLLSNIDSLNSQSVNNYLEEYSYLVYAVRKGELEAIKKLLSKGANPNGITNSGVTLAIPWTVIDFSSSKSIDIIKLLLKAGADINSEDLRGHTLLTSFFAFWLQDKRYTTPYYNNIIRFMLERGANPNGSIFFSPLYKIIEILPRAHTFITLYNICELLIAYGANPKKSFCTIYNKRIENHDAYTLIKSFKDKGIKYLKFYYLFNIKVVDVINRCSSPSLLLALSYYFKVPYNNREKKVFCRKVRELIEEHSSSPRIRNFNVLRPESTPNLSLLENVQSKKRKTEIHQNEYLFSGYAVAEFPDYELIKLYEEEKLYYFHVSEIPILLKGKNPFTQQELSESFLESLLEYKYYPPKTLHETLKNVEVFIHFPESVSSEMLFNKLSEYLLSYHSYLQLERIKSFSIKRLHKLYRVISKVNFFYLGGEKEEALSSFVVHLIHYLRNRGNALEIVAHKILQEIELDDVVKEILLLFPQKYIEKIISTGRDGYISFIDSLSRIIDINDVRNDRGFIKSLNEDQQQMLEFATDEDLYELYKKYIKYSIDSIINYSQETEIDWLVIHEQVSLDCSGI